MLRHAIVIIVLAGALAACGRSDKPAAAPEPALAASPSLLLAPEDWITVQSADRALGPVITGSVEAERRADLRAEISAAVLQVFKDNGQAVSRGDLLVRLDDTTIRESLASAEESLRAARQGFEQAQRQYERLQTLQRQGMTPMQALEDAEVRRNNAQSDLAAAESRVVTARQQLRRTEVRAPFDGVVSDRKVSAGDTAQIGKELLKVVDPRSMRLEGLVSADRVHELKVGQAVGFRINGYPDRDFAGRIKRIDAAADPTTRQVAVLVEFTEPDLPRVTGLYAEGNIESGSAQTLTVPESSVVRSGDAAYVWRVKDGRLGKVDVQLGERDARRGEYPVKAGLHEGDRILRFPGTSLTDGQAVELTNAPTRGQPAAPGPTASGK